MNKPVKPIDLTKPVKDSIIHPLKESKKVPLRKA